MSNFLFLMMGGVGTRVNESKPKQLIEINERPIFSYILKSYDDIDLIDEIIVVANSDWLNFTTNYIKQMKLNKKTIVVPGGKTRSHSIKAGLNSIKSKAKSDDVVLFHDATHPYIDVKGVVKTIKAIEKYGGATLTTFNYDTLYKMNNEGFAEKIVPREEIVVGASPEGFSFGGIFSIYNTASDEELSKMTSAAAIAIENGITIKVIETKKINLKITFKEDIETLRNIGTKYFTDYQSF